MATLILLFDMTPALFRTLFSLLVGTLLAACASSPITQTTPGKPYEVAAASEGVSWLSVVDQRQPEERERENRGGAVKLGDADLNMPAPEAVCIEMQRVIDGHPMAKQLQATLKGKTIGLSSFEITLVDRSVAPVPPSRYVQPGFAAFDYLVNSIEANLSASAHAIAVVTITVDGEQITAYGNSSSAFSPGTGSTLQPMRRAMDGLVGQLVKRFEGEWAQ